MKLIFIIFSLIKEIGSDQHRWEAQNCEYFSYQFYHVFGSSKSRLIETFFLVLITYVLVVRKIIKLILNWALLS